MASFDAWRCSSSLDFIPGEVDALSFTYPYPRPSVTLDVALFRVNAKSHEILLIQRKSDPFRGAWALPGGFLDMDENLEEGARRELEEETGLLAGSLTPLGAYGNVGRDPRGRTVTIAYYGSIPHKKSKVIAGDDAADVAWFDIEALPELAFDHDVIVADAIIKQSAMRAVRARPKKSTLEGRRT